VPRRAGSRASGSQVTLVALSAAMLVVIAFFASSSGASRGPGRQARAANGPDLYIKDTPADTGIEPNPDTGPMWVSEDIGVSTGPDLSYSPLPFTDSNSLPPLPNDNPEYRDPLYGVPNYVYVRIHNRGNSATTGTERLRVYFAKASTGLAWPAQFTGPTADGYVVGNTLYGDEITKPRKNAATATQAERDAYVQAIIDAATLPAFKFLDGLSYWHKQQQIHATTSAPRHFFPLFLPWHRDFINRYEAMLQKANPTVKLLYWDWTTNPANSTGGFNFFSSTFMGASGTGVGPISIGAPFMPTLGGPTVMRNGPGGTPPASSDASILSVADYPTFEHTLENQPNHGSAHPYIGGTNTNPSLDGDMSFINRAAQDPFFFLLHANVDRLWAKWQRNVSNLGRLDPALTYGLDSSDPTITPSPPNNPYMAPWNGTDGIEPYTSGGGYVVNKTAMDPSVVSPPIYDTAPLVIPVLQPGQAVVMQIPWYPPNPADFASFGADQGHFCLVARIETSTSAPFGMTFPEGTDLYTNTRNNNNIAWKNITVVDNFPGALRLSSVLIRNVSKLIVPTTLHFANVARSPSFFQLGRFAVDLKPALYKRWVAGGAKGKGVKRAGGTTVAIVSPNAFISNIRLRPGETFPVTTIFQLNKDYKPTQNVPKLDMVQTGTPRDPNAVVGGQRFELDVSKLVQVKAGDVWRYLDNGSNPGPKWFSAAYNDSKWKQGQAPLGFGDNTVTTINSGSPGKRHITTYFRHAFDVPDPSFVRTLRMRLRRDDGAVVYLNGKQIYRVNMPSGAVKTTSLATRDVGGLERDVFFPVPLKPQLLHQGTNVVAVEIHLASPRSNDLSFDLALESNLASTASPPEISFTSPANGGLFQIKRPIGISVEALDPDGKVAFVTFSADGKIIGRDASPPYAIQWKGAGLGPHRLRAVATDNQGLQATVTRTVSVLANTPPSVTLTAPADGTVFAAGQPISVTADASDGGGAVSRVEFFLRRMELFTDPDKLVGTDEKAPYAITLNDIAPGEYMLSAVAVDNLGLTGGSLPAMIMIK
jgi:hypothetical protein